MPRVSVGSQSQSFLVSMVSSPNDTLPLTTQQTAGNTTIARARSPVGRKPQVKSTSFSVPRIGLLGGDGESIMGGRTFDVTPTPPTRASPRSQTISTFRAAESGRGDLLPTTTTPRPLQTANRTRSMSSSTISQWNAKYPARGESLVTKTLRSRGKRHFSDEHAGSSMDSSTHLRSTPQHNEWGTSSVSHEKMRYLNINARLFNPKNTNFLQLIALLVITCLVWESYRRSRSTTEQFEKLKHDEGLMIMHLQKLEQASIQLHEVLGRLADTARLHNPMAAQEGQKADNLPVDAELIRVETQRLQQYEEELQHEVRGLSSKLQRSARDSIVKTFGEGPIQISFDVDFGTIIGAPERISISLGYDTPYAAWALIQQIQKDDWIGAKFTVENGFKLTLSSSVINKEAKLDFLEKSRQKHEAWTVGITELEGGGLQLFVNLQDNSETYKHEVCIGKVVEGFGTLQKLVASTRKLDGSDRPVTIKNAFASRMSKGKPNGFFA